MHHILFVREYTLRMPMNEKISELNEKIVKLKKKGFNNLVSFFIEFFMLNIVLSSTINYGNIYNLITETLPFFSRELLLSSSISLIVLSTSIRVVYAKYLNNKMDFLEGEVIKETRLQRKNYSKKINKDNNYTYQKQLTYHHIDTNLKNKQKIKVLKK